MGGLRGATVGDCAYRVVGASWSQASPSWTRRAFLPMRSINSPEAEQLRRDLLAVMVRIRESMPRTPAPADVAKGGEIWEGHFDGHPIERVIIYLRSSGCFWAIRESQQKGSKFRAGCLDCQHSVAGTTLGVSISAASYVRQFVDLFSRYDFSHYPVLCLYNEGSFYNERELPREARREILGLIGANPHIRGVILESLPEFLTDNLLEETTRLLRGKALEIGIGLESADPWVRDFCVNKSYDLTRFDQAARIVKRHASLLAYVLLKPSFLTEAEALEDALLTTRYAFERGADVVSIEPVNTGEYNMCGALSRLGLYRVPWLWTVLDVVRASAPLGEVRVGGSQFAPQYDRCARNCMTCTPLIYSALRRYNGSCDIRDIEGLSCACSSEWRAELARIYPPRIERVAEAVRRLSAVYPA